MSKSLKKTLIIVAIILVIVALIWSAVSKVINIYNTMVVEREEVDSVYANLETQLQRRADLIPNLVATVKGVAGHELDVVNSVTSARTQLMNADSVTDKANANASLSTAISQFLVMIEKYPEITATPEYAALRDELAGTENRIATSRRDYNAAVKEYNAFIIKFPNNMFANMFDMEKAEYFEADESSKEAPVVDFEN